MAKHEPHILEDSHNWQTALLTMEWGDDLKRLQSWVTGRTVAPHWREFVSNWLSSSNRDTFRVPTLTQILERCMDSWLSNTNSYFLRHPETTTWHEHAGLGHYVRLLTMIVRENMASNGIWKMAYNQSVKRYFEKALIIANCMREDWAQKGPVYKHFQSTRLAQNSQSLPRSESTRTVSITNGIKPAASPKDAPNGIFQAHNTANGSSNRNPNGKDKDTVPRPQSNGAQKPGQAQTTEKDHIKAGPRVAESESDKPRKFLKSLEEDLDREHELKEIELKKKLVEKNRPARKDTEPGEIIENVTPSKRAATDDKAGTLKKRKSDEVQNSSPELPRGLSSLLSADGRPIGGASRPLDPPGKTNGEASE